MLKKVLIVEDSSLQAKMYKTVFCNYPDCQLIFAQDGREALDILALEAGLELIILDINMPKMNGIAFLEAKEREGYIDIPVIVITTEDKDDDIRRALLCGANAYIKKPWKIAEIKGLVDKLVSPG